MSVLILCFSLLCGAADNVRSVVSPPVKQRNVLTPTCLSVHSITLERPDQEERFQFRSHSPGRLVILTTEPDVDAMIYVYNSVGQEIKHDDDSGGALRAKVELSMKPRATYVIGVRMYPTQKRPYPVKVRLTCYVIPD